jgi:hypothetical protein
MNHAQMQTPSQKIPSLLRHGLLPACAVVLQTRGSGGDLSSDDLLIAQDRRCDFPKDGMNEFAADRIGLADPADLAFTDRMHCLVAFDRPACAGIVDGSTLGRCRVCCVSGGYPPE